MELLYRVFVRVLRADRLALDKLKRLSADRNRLICVAEQVHFDAPSGNVVMYLVTELFQLEVAL